RVGVPVVRGTVRGPPGVPHATVPGELLRLDLTEPLLEVGQRAGRAFHGQAALSVQQRHTRGVVAAVLESSQAVQDDVEGLPMSYITNDAAHPAQRSYLSWSEPPEEAARGREPSSRGMGWPEAAGPDRHHRRPPHRLSRAAAGRAARSPCRSAA